MNTMDQTRTAVKVKKNKKERKQKRDNKDRALKRKMSNTAHNEDRDKKKHKTMNEDQTKKDYSIPRGNSSLPERDLQPGPSKPREYNSNNRWPQDYQTNQWSRGRREYQGYQGNYGDHRGQSRDRRPYQRNGPRDFYYRGQSRQWSPRTDYPPSEQQIQKVLNYIKKKEDDSKDIKDDPQHQQSYGEDVRGQYSKENEGKDLTSDKLSATRAELEFNTYHSSDSWESAEASDDSRGRRGTKYK